LYLRIQEESSAHDEQNNPSGNPSRNACCKFGVRRLVRGHFGDGLARVEGCWCLVRDIDARLFVGLCCRHQGDGEDKDECAAPLEMQHDATSSGVGGSKSLYILTSPWRNTLVECDPSHKSEFSEKWRVAMGVLAGGRCSQLLLLGLLVLAVPLFVEAQDEEPAEGFGCPMEVSEK